MTDQTHQIRGTALCELFDFSGGELFGHAARDRRGEDAHAVTFEFAKAAASVFNRAAKAVTFRHGRRHVAFVHRDSFDGPELPNKPSQFSDRAAACIHAALLCA